MNAPGQIEDKSKPEDELAGTEAPLIEHLIELRRRLIYSCIAIGVLFIGCWFFAEDILQYLMRPLEVAAGANKNIKFIYTAPQEIFFSELNVALFAALFLAFPVIASQVYMFVAPGLYKKERRAFIPYLVATPVFFVMGAAAMYYGVLPLALSYFLSQEVSGAGRIAVEMLPRVAEYLGFSMTLLLAFGICFQLPVILTLLASIEIVDSKQLKSWRKYSIVAILVISAFLTPPDPISMLGLAVPLQLLYEVSILSVRLIERRRQRAVTSEQTN